MYRCLSIIISAINSVWPTTSTLTSFIMSTAILIECSAEIRLTGDSSTLVQLVNTDWRVSPHYVFSKLIAMDGNNSLWQVDPAVTKHTAMYIDTRSTTSDIWILPAQVEIFKDEVKARAITSSQQVSGYHIWICTCSSASGRRGTTTAKLEHSSGTKHWMM